jgi:hypothetical protein
MKLREWLDNWSMTSLKVNATFMEMEFQPNDVDKNAAWELYIELITRVSTQYMLPEHGDETSALKSISRLFELTRETIKRNGRHCGEFTKIAVIVLNQVVRPFTTKWHRQSLAGAFDDQVQRALFRVELEELQTSLRAYTRMLASLAKVEDLTELPLGAEKKGPFSIREISIAPVAHSESSPTKIRLA